MPNGNRTTSDEGQCTTAAAGATSEHSEQAVGAGYREQIASILEVIRSNDPGSWTEEVEIKRRFRIIEAEICKVIRSNDPGSGTDEDDVNLRFAKIKDEISSEEELNGNCNSRDAMLLRNLLSVLMGMVTQENEARRPFTAPKDRMAERIEARLAQIEKSAMATPGGDHEGRRAAARHAQIGRLAMATPGSGREGTPVSARGGCWRAIMSCLGSCRTRGEPDELGT